MIRVHPCPPRFARALRGGESVVKKLSRRRLTGRETNQRRGPASPDTRTRAVPYALRFTFWLLLTCSLSHLPTCHADVIPPSRLYNWGAYSGIAGGGNIPHVSTVYDDSDTDPMDPGYGITDSLESIDNTGATVVRTAFQNAINNCPSNQVIGVPAGTFLLVSSAETATLSWTGSGRVLRGRGPGVTTLVNAGNSGGYSTINIQNGSHDDDFSSATKYDISNTSLAKGDSNITTSVNHAFAVGDFVWMDQRTNTGYIFLAGNSGNCGFCSGRTSEQRVYGQMSRVVAIPAANQITIEPPIIGQYQSTNSPQIMKAVGITQMNGIESLTFSNRSTATAQYWFHIVGSANTWFTNVEIAVINRRGIQVINSLGFQVQQCDIHHGNGAEWTAPAYDADYAYGIYLGYGTTLSRILDSMLWKLHVGVAFEGSISGNVVYANFHTNQVFDDRYTSQSCFAHHGTSSHGNLWEHNNINAGLVFDYVWAGGNEYTLFRNRAKLDFQHDGVNVSQIAFVLDIARQHRFHNVVGNVLGENTTRRVHTQEGDAVTQPNGVRAIYRLGYTSAFSSTAYASFETAVTNGMILKANFCIITNDTGSIPSAESIGSTNLVDSYLYSSKPSWWGVSNWPSIGPDKTPTVENSMWIPAMGRYYAKAGAGETNWFVEEGEGGGPDLGYERGTPRLRSNIRIKR